MESILISEEKSCCSRRRKCGDGLCQNGNALQGRKVSIVYRRRQKDMTALEAEIEGAIAEGIELLTLKAPKRVEADEKAMWQHSGHNRKSAVYMTVPEDQVRTGQKNRKNG